MRSDFKKVIHEGYRTGKETSKKVNKPRHTKRLRDKAENSSDKELFPKQEPASRKRRYGWDCKRKTHSHGPKVKFLASRVGKPWDEVWSEICKAGVQKDFEYLVHVDYIGDDKDGRPLDSTGNTIYNDYFVDGLGILRRAPKRHYRRKKLSKEINYVWVGSQLYGRRTDGLWYRLHLKPIPETNWQWVERPLYRQANGIMKTMMLRTDLSDRPYCMWLLRNMYKNSDGLIDGWYCERYTQVNKKELRQIKKALL